MLEYLPYRKSDYTVSRDHLRHPWLASHGFVVVRADMRGTGEATGLYTGEYLAQEQADAKEILGKKFEMNFSLRFDRSFMLFISMD